VLAPLADALSGLGRPPSAAVLAAFARYLDLLLDANSRMNLTAVRDADAVVRRHFVESAVFGGALEAQGLLRDGVRVVDVGSGAGFPGLPLKLLWPHLRLTLVEATGKKAAFLSEVVQALALPGVEVCAMRAETAGRDPALRERFDLAVSRAVAPLAVLAELTLPLLRVGGSSAGIKGSRLAEEMRAAAVAIERLGGGAPRELPLPHGVAPPEPAPRFFVLTKSRPTPVDLPRRAGVTSSNPLR
jgi:16S rRNA (guanine527-N7)-methyltransferase